MGVTLPLLLGWFYYIALYCNLLGTHWGQSGSDGLKALSAPQVIVTEASMKASSVFILSTQLNVMLSPIRIGFPSQSILFRFFSSGGRGGFIQWVPKVEKYLMRLQKF